MFSSRFQHFKSDFAQRNSPTEGVKDPQVFTAGCYLDHFMYTILFFFLFNRQIIQWDWIFQLFCCPGRKLLAEFMFRAGLCAEASCLALYGEQQGLKPVLRWHTAPVSIFAAIILKTREKLPSWAPDTHSRSSTHCWVLLRHFCHSLSAQATISSEQSSFLTGHRWSVPKDCRQPLQTSLGTHRLLQGTTGNLLCM